MAGQVIYTVNHPYQPGVIEVYGDAHVGRYEWRVVVGGRVKRDTGHECDGCGLGYGIPEIALRDALSEETGAFQSGRRYDLHPVPLGTPTPDSYWIDFIDTDGNVTPVHLPVEYETAESLGRAWVAGYYVPWERARNADGTTIRGSDTPGPELYPKGPSGPEL